MLGLNRAVLHEADSTGSTLRGVLMLKNSSGSVGKREGNPRGNGKPGKSLILLYNKKKIEGSLGFHRCSRGYLKSGHFERWKREVWRRDLWCGSPGPIAMTPSTRPRQQPGVNGPSPVTICSTDDLFVIKVPTRCNVLCFSGSILPSKF